MSHIVIVPAGVLALSTQAEFVALIVPDDIERHLDMHHNCWCNKWDCPRRKSNESYSYSF